MQGYINILFTSKRLDALVPQNKPEQGTIGWFKAEDKLIEYVFIIKYGWIPVEEYKQYKLRKKLENIEFHKLHPEILRGKIRLKSGNGKMLRIARPYDHLPR